MLCSMYLLTTSSTDSCLCLLLTLGIRYSLKVSMSHKELCKIWNEEYRKLVGGGGKKTLILYDLAPVPYFLSLPPVWGERESWFLSFFFLSPFSTFFYKSSLNYYLASLSLFISYITSWLFPARSIFFIFFKIFFFF